MMGVKGLCASPFLLFLSLPFAFEIARVSLEKNISTAALIYPDQDLKLSSKPVDEGTRRPLTFP